MNDIKGNFCTMETKFCVWCRKEYETGNLLLTTRTDRTFENMHACSGIGLCDDCRKEAEEADRVYLVEAIETDDSFDLKKRAYSAKAGLINDDDLLKQARKYRFMLMSPETCDLLAAKLESAQ